MKLRRLIELEVRRELRRREADPLQAVLIGASVVSGMASLLGTMKVQATNEMLKTLMADLETTVRSAPQLIEKAKQGDEDAKRRLKISTEQADYISKLVTSNLWSKMFGGNIANQKVYSPKMKRMADEYSRQLKAALRAIEQQPTGPNAINAGAGKDNTGGGKL